MRLHPRQTLDAFSAYHLSDANNVAHWFTTPLGLFGFLSLTTALLKSAKPSTALTLAYVALLHLDASVPSPVVLECAILLLACLLLSASLHLGKWASLAVACLGYGLQDLSHLLTGEETFQQHTWGDLAGNPLGACVALFFQHVFYLQPLVVAVAPQTLRDLTSVERAPRFRFVSCLLSLFSPAAVPAAPYRRPAVCENNDAPPCPRRRPLPRRFVVPLLLWSYGCYAIDSDASGLPHTFARARALFGKMRESVERADCATVRAWAMAQKPPSGVTSHWWVSDLGSDANKAFHRLEECASVKALFATKFDPARYRLEPVLGMNEVASDPPPFHLTRHHHHTQSHLKDNTKHSGALVVVFFSD